MYEIVTCNLIGPGGFSNYHNYGLGNQLFLVATVLSYSKENNLLPVFPDIKNKKYGNYVENIFNKLNTTQIAEEDIMCEYFEPSFSFNKIPIKKIYALMVIFKVKNILLKTGNLF